MTRPSGATWRAAVATVFLLAMVTSCGAVVAGIDFSSKFFKAVLVKPGSPFSIVTNPQSKRKTSANLAFYRGERVFGHDADGVSTRKPAYTFPSAHFCLGAPEDHVRVARHLDMREAAHEVQRGNRSEPVFVLPDAPDAHPAFGEIKMTPEMYAAQMLGFMRWMIEQQAGQQLAGAVLAVPSFWQHTERTALLQAAELAGVKVLRVTDELTAAATQFAIDRVYSNDTLVLFYSMGATSAQASLFRFGSYTARDGKVRGTAAVIGKGWDDSVGGDAFDDLLLGHAAELFNAKHGDKLEGGDVRTLPRAMAKLRKAVGKVKEVLSANNEFPLIVEAVATTKAGADIDFRATITRKAFLKLVEPLIARAAQPALQACLAAGVEPLDVEVVEIIGGGVRVPAVQEALRKALRRDERPPTPDRGVKTAEGEEPVPVPALGVHLNGDEAVAFGAAFMAANLSKSFRVRPVGMSDSLPFGVTARVFTAGAEAANAASDDAAASDAAALKTLSLRPYGRLGAARALRLQTTTDVEVALELNSSFPGGVSNGLGPSLGRFRVTGLESVLSDERVARLGLTPNVTIRVLTGADGTVDVRSALATVRYTPEPTPEPEAQEAEASKDAEDDSSGASDDKQEQEKAEEGSEDAQEAAASESAAEAEEEKAETAEANATADAEEAAPTPRPAPRPRTLRFPLTVTRVADAAGVRPLTTEEMSAISTLLVALQKDDDRRSELARVRNDLESAVMATRDAIDEEGEDLMAVTTEEQRQEVDALVTSLDDWLYGDGSDADAEAVREKQADLNDLMEPIRHRIAERTALPKAAAALRKAMSKAKKTIASWAKGKPWIGANLTAEAEAVVTSALDWLEEGLANQTAAPQHETPVFVAKAVKARISAVRRAIKAVDRLPKPTPTPAPTPEATEDEAPTATEREDAGDEDAQSAADEDADAESQADTAAAEDEATQQEEASDEQPSESEETEAAAKAEEL